ncbi:MAG TPA: hypothetical protein VEQ85_12610 [Lacipirellulaceae bacterium]|nr:hypothetical protein [Lacipirellulaceae bacterium]
MAKNRMHAPRRHAPIWFRYGVIAAAVMVLCSCRASAPAFRVAAAPGTVVASTSVKTTVRGQDPASQAPPAMAAVPAYLTPEQIARATPLPPGFQAAPCGPGGCPCCSGGAACNGPDGITGPADEYLCDGGDYGARAGVVTDGSVIGLEPEDSIAHYETVDGRIVVTPSNKVCLYAPRFAAIRHVVDLRALARVDAAEGAIRHLAPAKIDEEDRAASSLAAIEPTIHRAKTPPSLLRERQQAGELDRDRRVAATLGSMAPYVNLQTIRTGEVVGTDLVRIARASLAAITWAGDQAAQVLLDSREAQAEIGVQTPGTIYLLVEPNNPQLRLIKLASTGAALPGEEVEFTLRFDNVGDRVIGNVTILDSLTTRLEYIEGSQKCSEEATFDARANEGDSLKLRWELTQPLKPGDGGVIQFRCRVR